MYCRWVRLSSRDPRASSSRARSSRRRTWAAAPPRGHEDRDAGGGASLGRSPILTRMTHERVPHTSHWGAFEAEVSDGTVVAIRPYRNDPDPSPLLGNIVDSLRHPPRVTQPMIRAGWLHHGPRQDPPPGAAPL